jgi:hypothetical protein
MIPPPENLQYSGPVAVMVGPACASACEFFSYAMTVNDRAMVVGQYPSDGAGGSVEQFVMPEKLNVQMTIGRAVDAQGNIHLEGVGVTPTVKVPVTVETLQKQANGEDVVLDAAVKALSAGDSADAGAGAGVTPSGKPKLASKSDAEKALKSGTPFLQDKATEKHDPAEYAKPGVLSFTVPLSASEPLVWAYVWCAKDADTLKQNFTSIKLAFQLDGEDVTSQMNTTDLVSNNQPCRLVYTVLQDWPAGEHRLTTSANFAASINDGTADYAPGDYVLDYKVTVKP